MVFTGTFDSTGSPDTSRWLNTQDGADQLHWSIDGQVTQTVNQSQSSVWSSMTGHDGILTVAIN